MNLWLKSGKKPVRVDLDLFSDYPHFHYSFEQYEDFKVPRFVKVRWEPTSRFLEPLEGPEDEEDSFIRSVAAKIAEGEAVPPILLNEGRLFDGRHRAWAADELGLKKVPVAEIGQYWSQ